MKALLLALAALAPLPAAAQTLSGAEWRVVELTGGPLSGDVTPTLAFTADGKVGGHAGCNRFSGGWAQDGMQLTFTGMAATRMACDPARMEIEARIFAALENVTAMALTPGGALELLGGAKLLIRAVR